MGDLKIKYVVAIAMMSLMVVVSIPMNVASGQSFEDKYWAIVVASSTLPQTAIHDAIYMYHVLSEHYFFDGIYHKSRNQSTWS